MSTPPAKSSPLFPIIAIVALLAVIIAFFALPWYAKPGTVERPPLPYMPSLTTPEIKLTGYQLSELHSILLVVPLGAILMGMVLFLSNRPRAVKTAIAAVCGILPLLVYVLLAGDDLRYIGSGFAVAAMGYLVGILIIAFEPSSGSPAAPPASA